MKPSKFYAVLHKERIASIRDIQKNPSRSLQGMTRVMRGSITHGFFFSMEEFEELMEDVEAAFSTSLRVAAKRVRAGVKKGEMISLEAVAKEYGL